MKKFLYIVALTFPFFIIYSFWILSAFSFNVYTVFDSSVFWVLTIVYYTVAMWIPVGFLASGEADSFFEK